MKKWRRADDEIIRKMAGRFSTASIAKKLGRTEAALRTHASAIGVSLRYTTRKNDKITIGKLRQTAEYLATLGTVRAVAESTGQHTERVRYLVKLAIKHGIIKNAKQ